jgi:hypothetical protein
MLVDAEPVLDIWPTSREAGSRIRHHLHAHDKGPIEMIDPGALGTLIIGLDRARRDQESDLRPRPTFTRRRDRQAGRLLAGRLRRLADALEARYPVAGSTGLGGTA